MIILEVIVKVAVVLGGVGLGIYYLLKPYFFAKREDKALAELTKKQLWQIIIIFWVSIFCIAFVLTMLLKYLYPDNPIFAPEKDIQLSGGTPTWLNFSFLLMVLALTIYTVSALFKKTKNL